MTVQRPAKREANQKSEHVEAWLNEQYPDIHKSAKNEGAKIFWGDETAAQILDNLRVHHSKKVSKWVQENKEKISLFYLPPYSPEYNPNEYLNKNLKRNIGSQAMVNDISELETNTNNFMKNLSDDSDHVKAYFTPPFLAKYNFH